MCARPTTWRQPGSRGANMNARHRLLAIVTAITILSASSHAATVAQEKWSELLRLNRDFVCPEALPDQRARTAALETFADRVAQVYGPVTTVDRLVALRTKLLQAHRCRRTLANIATY